MYHHLFTYISHGLFLCHSYWIFISRNCKNIHRWYFPGNHANGSLSRPFQPVWIMPGCYGWITKTVRYIFAYSNMKSKHMKPVNIRIELNRNQDTQTGGYYHVYSSDSCVLTTPCLLSHESFHVGIVAETDLLTFTISASLFRQAIDQSLAFRH